MIIISLKSQKNRSVEIAEISLNDFYVVGNNVRITFNGNVLESNPMQIGATK